MEYLFSFSTFDLLAKSIFWVLFWFVPIAFFFYLFYFLISLPLRRQERARFFLDLLEAGFRQGRSAENSIATVSETRDGSLGARFHLLGAYVRGGVPLSDALKKIPRLLPPQVVAMLRVGEEIGDVRKILPAARGLLRDANSQTRSAFNYLLIVVVVALPVMPLILFTLKETVIPKYQEIFEGTLGAGSLGAEIKLPPYVHLVTDSIGWIAAAQFVFGMLVFGGICFYIGGPRLQQWLLAGLTPIGDLIPILLPWRHKRLQRDFCAMLALLLDAEIPEAKSIQLAAESTANRHFLQRARKALLDLQSGKNLSEALRHFDDADEFSWRLSNAAHADGKFSVALAGWIESLDAKAFQQEQIASQLVTTSLTLLNGVVVGVVVTGLFQCLIALINKGVMW